ncbi:glycoside hydrolase family 27 protein [Draconibacterium orientale]|uniref:glycoside hydrolase family 27 protein n=1 Tax=Draconibacterium orientale TaxID=1168034 RepID=UPI002ABDC82F|nr:glycoside hydrolase family 27 protein [Draconibacterium orientale]
MKKLKYLGIGFILLAFNACVDSASKNVKSKISASEIKVAQTPPMGWNSFDAYDCRINEEEFRGVVDYMADNLLEYGWEYAVIDYIWWHPEPGNWDTPRRKGHPNLRYKSPGEPLHPEYTTHDEYGRLLPSIERFPSSANGQGFKPIGDYVHSKGMKFGIHIMRGVHRYCAFQDLPIKGTNYTLKDIAEPWDTCGWCNHMWGVDPTKPGAQEYYNSLFEMYADWGVDFIKADDTMFPPYHEGEIAMMRKAIENCGRPIVLSLSCGEAPLGQADHLKANANMWRISADYWDKWESLEHNFDLLNVWAPHAQPGAWPDADMIPIGKLSLDDRPHGPERMTQFTKDEQITMLTLWSIAQSPLMLGNDMLNVDEFTLSLITNPEVLTVNQNGSNARQIFVRNGQRFWISTDIETGDKYIALFNLNDTEREVVFDLEWDYLRDTYNVRDLWARKNIGTVKGEVRANLPAHGAALYRLSKK